MIRIFIIIEKKTAIEREAILEEAGASQGFLAESGGEKGKRGKTLMVTRKQKEKKT